MRWGADVAQHRLADVRHRWSAAAVAAACVALVGLGGSPAEAGAPWLSGAQSSPAHAVSGPVSSFARSSWPVAASVRSVSQRTSSLAGSVASLLPPECLDSAGAPLAPEPLSWDSPPLAASPCSVALGSYSQETAQELAALRVSVLYGLGLLLLMTSALLVTTWGRK